MFEHVQGADIRLPFYGGLEAWELRKRQGTVIAQCGRETKCARVAQLATLLHSGLRLVAKGDVGSQGANRYIVLRHLLAKIHAYYCHALHGQPEGYDHNQYSGDQQGIPPKIKPACTC